MPFKAPFFEREELWRRADEFRSTHWDGRLPVEVLAIAEFKLGLEIRPIKNLKKDCDAEASLLSDLKTLVLDSDSYMDDRYQNRLRFSVAHELGHLALHHDFVAAANITSVEAWLAYYRDIPEKEYGFIEYHANEFAGRLLVPHGDLTRELASAKAQGVKGGLPLKLLNSDQGREYLASAIHRPFGVSAEVVSRRIGRETDLWPFK